MQQRMRVCIGGTFNILHKGHKVLFEKAFETAGDTGWVFIGVTDGDMLNDKKFVTPYDKRVAAIKEYISTIRSDNRFDIVKISSKYGLAVDGEYDAIITSPETIENAIKINKNRISQGKKPLEIITIPYVLAEDDIPISSTRIHDKIIDKNGKIK